MEEELFIFITDIAVSVNHSDHIQINF